MSSTPPTTSTGPRPGAPGQVPPPADALRPRLFNGATVHGMMGIRQLRHRCEIPLVIAGILTEADRIGVELAARAGYDPRAAITLWQKMAQVSGAGGTPEFLSTHPSAASRIRDLQDYSARVMPLYQQSGR